MWYDLNKTLTYNCLYNFVVGNRGCGKTYAAKKRAIKLFLSKGYQFVYLRRYETELDNVKESLFNDIILNNEFEGHKIEYKQNCYFVDGKLAGYAMCLSKAHYLKSASFPLVHFIIFDEFLIEEGTTSHYLRNEVMTFLSFYETIARKRPVIVFFLSNAVTMVNPYTLFFKLSLPKGQLIIRKDDLLLELVQDVEFIIDKKNTRFGKIVEGTKFADYSIDNKFLLDSDVFIQRKTAKATYYFTFKYEDMLFGVWVDYSEGKFYVSEDIDPFCKLVYSITLDDHSPNTMLLKRASKAMFFNTFIQNYKLGNVYFENLKVKNVVYDVIRLTLT
jgi:hypothetical protein